MSTIQKDFDRIALVSPDGSLQNNHYHNLLLRHLPPNCSEVLEIGCGKGEFSRRLAEKSVRVLALDLSPEMIRIARAQSEHFPNIEFKVADVMKAYDVLPPLGLAKSWIPGGRFDCIVSIATLHHLPLREMLVRMKESLKPGGLLLVLDLFEPEGFLDALTNVLAIPLSVTLRLVHHRRLLPHREARVAWAAHEAHDIYPTMREIRALCADTLPGARIKKHLLWRYSIVWQKSTVRQGIDTQSQSREHT